MNLEFATAQRVIFGRDELKQAGALASAFGSRAMIFAGAGSARRSGALARLEESLKASTVVFTIASVEKEPTVALIDALAAQAREWKPDSILALGGGSVIDAAKAVGTLLTNGGSVRDYLEGVGAGRAIEKASCPVIAIPTTAGTGAEVTKNAVIRADDGTFKKSMRSPLSRPAVALVDPALSSGAPPNVTAAAGLDAQTQLIEAFTSRRAGILTDGLAREGLTLIAPALERAIFNPEDAEARDSLAMAALLSGMALDNAGLGAVHGLAGPMGAMREAPHGVICACLLPEITEANIEAAEREDPNGKTSRKYREVSRIMTGAPEGSPMRLVAMLKLQRKALRIPPLASFGFGPADFPRIVEECRAGSMLTNPVYLNNGALTRAMAEALEAAK